MNQQCKVCGEPAAGFHFGAFTCEGCKSFFGRSYNNLSSISECKNGGECVINKKNRTACKACRLRKCLLVGMSKSGSRYGRRSNWFKIHCLLQEQQHQHQQQQQQQQHHHHGQRLQQQHHHQLQHQLHHQRQRTSPSMSHHQHHQVPGHQQRSKEEAALMLGLEDYKNLTSPSISSPESQNSDSSVEVSERRAAYGLHPGFRPLHPAHLHPQQHGELSALSKEMMNLPLGFHLGGMPLVPPTFHLPPPSLSIFSPYLYAAAAATAAAPAPHLPAHHPIAFTRTSSPPIDSRNATSATTAIPFVDETCSNNNNNNEEDDNEEHDDEPNVNNNNNNRNARNQNVGCAERLNESPRLLALPIEKCNKRFYLDAILKSQQAPSIRSSPSIKNLSGHNSPGTTPDPEFHSAPPQDNPMDLSMRSKSMIDSGDSEDESENVDMTERHSDEEGPPLKRRPIDLTTRS